MYTFRLTDISFHGGSSLPPSDLTVIIGPNNVGKSRILKEIVWKTTNNREQSVIVSAVDFTLPQTLRDLTQAYDVRRYQERGGTWIYRTLNPDMSGQYSRSGGPWPDSYKVPTAVPIEEQKHWLTEHFGHGLIAYLTTEQRLQCTKESPSQSNENEAQNLLQAFYSSGTPTETTVKAQLKAAFGQEVALDFTVSQRLCLRVGEDFGHVPPDPRDAKPIMQTYPKLDDQGDGIRSFTGIVISLASLKRGVFLIDEPEAFLHPPQAYRMGRFLAEQAGPARQILLATHSADILRGILSRTHDVTILRVDRFENTNSFRQLDPENLSTLTTDPLLSSARVLEGLFYSGAVIVESDSDARFYHAASTMRREDLDLHFVNADNKQTVPRISELYRSMGVRCAGIVDFDVLNDHIEFVKHTDSIGLDNYEREFCLETRRKIASVADRAPAAERLKQAVGLLKDLFQQIEEVQGQMDGDANSQIERTLTLIRSRCYEAVNSTKKWQHLKRLGRNGLPPELQADFDSLSNICKRQGLLINPLGELESMLTDCGIEYTTDKRGWIRQALQLLPNLQVDDTKSPWCFIKEVHHYLTQPSQSAGSIDHGADQRQLTAASLPVQNDS